MSTIATEQRTGAFYVKQSVIAGDIQPSAREHVAERLRRELSVCIGNAVSDGRAYVVKCTPVHESTSDEDKRAGLMTFVMRAGIALRDHRDAEIGEACVIDHAAREPFREDSRIFVRFSLVAGLETWRRAS